MNVSWESTNAVSLPSVQTKSELMIAHATMVFKGTSGLVKM